MWITVFWTKVFSRQELVWRLQKNDARGLNEQLSRVFEEMRADGTTRTIIGRYLSDLDKYLEVDCAAG